ncbi:MAG: hypothetical protein IPG89_09995 [Bacteroidetes bacterium]|nr:hypothetical protein [Bacteroidota bacterium]
MLTLYDAEIAPAIIVPLLYHWYALAVPTEVLALNKVLLPEHIFVNH